MSVYEGIMKGLQEAVDYNEGKITPRKNTITIEPVRNFNATKIKKIRSSIGMTQVLFAGFMGVSQKTVEAWECGRNTPDGPARRILELVEKDPKFPEKCGIVSR